MKISVKKKYVLSIAGIVSGGLGWMFITEIVRYISHESITILIAPLVFLVSIIYIIHFWINLQSQNKFAEKVSKEASPDDPQMARKIKEHLSDKTFEEAYTLNFLDGKLKLTKSWPEQREMERTEVDPDMFYNLKMADKKHKKKSA